jgi:predicted mannosyl-3-phosphoglycerate phosphatase (HAD superfamily)
MTLIFTDVDGTLIDAERTTPPAAAHASRRRHEVILASSRAVPELQAMQREWNWGGALVAEDGAVIVDDSGTITVLGTDVETLRTVSAPVLAPLEIAPHHTQSMRRASILLPRDVASADRIRACAELGLTLAQGGSWATLTGGADKGRAAGAIAAARGVLQWVAIGNDGNDLALLRAAHRAFVIRNPGGHHPALAAVPGAVLLHRAGPDGWAEMVAQLEPGSDAFP